MSRYQKGKVNLDFTEARDSEWQWHQLGHMQVCTSLQTDNHASTPPLSFLEAGCPSCRPTNSVKALKAYWRKYHKEQWCHFAMLHGINLITTGQMLRCMRDNKCMFSISECEGATQRIDFPDFTVYFSTCVIIVNTRT